MKPFSSFLLTCLFCAFCYHLQAQSIDAAHLASQYLEAVENAAVPTAAKQYDKLVVIDPSNKALQWKKINGEDYVLCVSWKGDVSYFPKTGVYNTGKWSKIWVTASPQLLDRFHSLNPADTNMRLLQLIGLPPTSVYTHFVEMWVRPQDLKRPCPDPEINDSECNLCFTKYLNVNGQDSLDTAWVNWINETRIGRYYPCDPLTKYPWTELGYTYDWNAQNKRHIGLSEFVISKFTDVYIERILTTSEYLQQSK